MSAARTASRSHVSSLSVSNVPKLTPSLVNKVAEAMGDRFSAGAIVQHIAKVRCKMQVEKDTDKPELLVPPAVRKGSITRPASSTYTKKRKVTNPAEASQASNSSSTTKSKGNKIKRESGEDGDDEATLKTEYSDSDGEYHEGAANKKKAKKVKKPTGKRGGGSKPPTPAPVKTDIEDDVGNVATAPGSPGVHTRGVKADYREMADEEEVSGLEDYEDENAEPAPKPSARKLPSSTEIASPNAKSEEKALVIRSQVPRATPRFNKSGAASMPSITDGSDGYDGYNGFTGYGGFNHVSARAFADTNN